MQSSAGFNRADRITARNTAMVMAGKCDRCGPNSGNNRGRANTKGKGRK